MKKKPAIISFTTILLCVFSISFCTSQSNNPAIEAIVAGDKLNVRIKPDANAKVVFQLPITSRVRITKTMNKVTVIGEMKGKWVYITHEHYGKDSRGSTVKKGTIEGWVFDYFLAYENRYRPATSFNYSKLNISAKHYSAEYIFNPDGTYKKTHHVPCYIYTDGDFSDSVCSGECNSGADNKSIDCIAEGRLLQYLNIYKGHNSDMFYINEKNQLCSFVCNCCTTTQ